MSNPEGCFASTTQNAHNLRSWNLIIFLQALSLRLSTFSKWLPRLWVCGTYHKMDKPSPVLCTFSLYLPQLIGALTIILIKKTASTWKQRARISHCNMRKHLSVLPKITTTEFRSIKRHQQSDVCTRYNKIYAL